MPNVLTLEPDQAITYCINLVRARQQFSVEIDPTLRGMKDVVAVHRGGVLESRPGWSHIRRRATDRDGACQYVVNLIGAELSFQVNPERVTNRDEWLVLVELRSSGRKEA